MIYARAMKRSSIALVFVLGCFSGGFASRMADSPASAQGGPARWEYNCGTNADVTSMNQAGALGWELATTTTHGNDLLYCFKRPRA